MTNTKIYKAEEIAKYFIYLASKKVIGENNEREGLTNLKLQKILYLAQAYYLSKLNKPLFKNKIEAWTYGPVIPDVYHQYKRKGNQPLVVVSDNSEIHQDDKVVLEKIWDSFGGYSTSKLVDITHSHTPWKEAFETSSKNISFESIKEYYKPLFGC